MFARFENHLEVKFSACAHISVHTTFPNEAEKCFLCCCLADLCGCSFLKSLVNRNCLKLYGLDIAKKTILVTFCCQLKRWW